MSVFKALIFALFLVASQCYGSRQVVLSCGNDATEQKGAPGSPGKRGPLGERGLQGPVGPKGEAGQCDPNCRSEYNELSGRVQRMERLVEAYSLPKSCREAFLSGQNRSGLYNIYNPRNRQYLEVYCDQTTDGGGWLVFQRRTDGSENFYRTWEDYKEKFGNLSNEFWLGMENLHALLAIGNYELRIELKDCANVRKHAKYSVFSIGSEQQMYKLTVSGYSGNAGKSVKKNYIVIGWGEDGTFNEL
ncbi:ficolin-1-like [Ciona intestinalis]